ncbi:MAG: kelch repeat-containing protein [Polyangia bacterium]
MGALGPWAGCKPQAPTCAQSSCLTLSLHAPPGQSLTAADAIVRDGDTLEKVVLGGRALARFVLSAPAGRVDSTRRAIYVRAISEDGGGRHSLTGQFEGTAASSSVDVALTTHCASCRPSARHGAAMTYEPLARTVLLHGGMGTAGVPLDDLWAWNGLYWNQLATGPGPVARSGHVMAHDPQTGMVLLAFGQGPNETLDDTWLLDPKTLRWQKVAGVGPDARRHAAPFSIDRRGESGPAFVWVVGDGEWSAPWRYVAVGWGGVASRSRRRRDSRPLVPGTLPRCRMV